ncbi:NAD-dependent malic enzyme, partial [Actinacidiphila oryziradicis]
MAAEIVNPRTDTSSDSDSDLDHFPIDPAFALHRGGKMEVSATVPVRDAEDLSLAY